LSPPCLTAPAANLNGSRLLEFSLVYRPRIEIGALPFSFQRPRSVTQRASWNIYLDPCSLSTSSGKRTLPQYREPAEQFLRPAAEPGVGVPEDVAENLDRAETAIYRAPDIGSRPLRQEIAPRGARQAFTSSIPALSERRGPAPAAVSRRRPGTPRQRPACVAGR